jgi:putative membrane protein
MELMMMGYAGGLGAGSWLVMAVFWVGLLVLIGWTVLRAFPNGENRASDTPRQETPEGILDRRYAAGELDSDTYQAMRSTLASTRSVGR